MAMRAHDATRVATLRLLLAATANKEIELRKKAQGAQDSDIIAVIRTEVRKRKEASAAFSAAGRKTQAAREDAECEILQRYLPEELSDAALEKIVSEITRTEKAAGPAAFGRVMKEVMSRAAGRASGERVSAVVRHALDS